MEKPTSNLSREDRVKIARYLETQRGRPQARPPRTAGIAVGRVVRPLAKKFGSGTTDLDRHWPQIVGDRWAKISKPERFTGGRDGRTLIISAPGAAASLIMASSGPIIERLNGFLGEGSVARIKVVQRAMKTPLKTKSKPLPPRGLTPSEAKELQSGLENVTHSGLRDALEKLGRGALTRSPK